MKKLLLLLSLLLGIVACGVQALPTQAVGNIVNPTSPAIAQNSTQVSTVQPTFTPVSIQKLPTAAPIPPSEVHYYWPTTLPEGYALNAANSGASDSGFALEFINPSKGTLSIWGGDYIKFTYCAADSIPQKVKEFDGCFPQSTGGGFSVQWKEKDVPYSIGGFGLSRDLALQITEQLESLDINAWRERLRP